MLVSVEKRGVLIALLLVAVTTFIAIFNTANLKMWHAQITALSRASDAKRNIHVSDQTFPLPDAQHTVVTMNSLHYLSQLLRGKDNVYVARLLSHDLADRRNRTIVLRYRANTSTDLDPTPQSGRISVVFFGRTGNCMYMYAGLYGIARRNGMRHVISANNPLLTLFRLNTTMVESDRPGRGWVQYVVEPGDYDKRIEYFDPRTDVELVGTFNNWKYIEDVMGDLIRNQFRFRDAIQQEADNFLRSSMANFDLSPADVAVIAVHIRRTDFMTIRQKVGMAVANKDYFTHAVAFFNRLFDNKTMYVVCSDDIGWSKVNFVTESPSVFSVGHSADVDFAILSRCNHSIITMGTFGRWSAYMASGVTVYHCVHAPTEVPLDVAYRKVNPNQNPFRAWIPLS